MTSQCKNNPPTPCHTLSQKSKDPPTPFTWRNIWMAPSNSWPLWTTYIAVHLYFMALIVKPFGLIYQLHFAYYILPAMDAERIQTVESEELPQGKGGNYASLQQGNLHAKFSLPPQVLHRCYHPPTFYQSDIVIQWSTYPWGPVNPLSCLLQNFTCKFKNLIFLIS